VCIGAALGIALCACDAVETPTDPSSEPGVSTTAQNSVVTQGEQLQGVMLQGVPLQGTKMLGYRFSGATQNGAPLQHVRVERGELVAERGSTTLRGTALAGAHLLADTRNLSVDPPMTATVEYRIATVAPELPQYDPTHTGNTFLYKLEQWVPESESWQQACPVDPDGRSVAIPLAAIWNEHGDRIESSTLFTFGCTTGVIAKCYRWGYRPWVTGYGDLVTMHQTCTRAARADYCGNGVPHTHENTRINIWDTLPPPGPIQSHGGLLPPFGMLFEAGWNTGGAVCFSHTRWLLGGGLAIAQVCPDRLLALGLVPLVCDTIAEVLGYDPDAKIFNETSVTNIDLGQ
jgi:hypothetical protein